jgi:hypothetical protein
MTINLSVVVCIFLLLEAKSKKKADVFREMVKRALTPADELMFIRKAYSDNPCASLHSFQAGYFYRHRRFSTSLVIEFDTLRRPLL